MICLMNGFSPKLSLMIALTDCSSLELRRVMSVMLKMFQEVESTVSMATVVPPSVSSEAMQRK